MDEEIELQLDNPLEWVIENQELGVELDVDQFTEVIIDNIDIFCKINKKDLTNEFQKMNTEIIKETRAKLIENCSSLLPDKYIFTTIRKTSAKRLCDDIYILI